MAQVIFNVARHRNRGEISFCNLRGARLCLECKGDAAGIEALVFCDGAVTLPVQKFRDLLKTYKGTRFLTFEWGADGLHIQNFRMPVLDYDPRPKPPADFQVFRVAAPPGGSATTHGEGLVDPASRS
jgi:hypothetical protein